MHPSLRFIRTLPLVALAALLFAGCGTPTTPLHAGKNAQPADNLTGLWTADQGNVHLSFDATGKFELYWVATSADIAATPALTPWTSNGQTYQKLSGNWSAEESEVAFLNSTKSGVCPGMVGTYFYKIKAGVLTLNVVTDDCAARHEHLEYTFTFVAGQ